MIAVGSGLHRPPLRIRRHRPSCHLCKLLQQRAEVKCSTCVASINRISRSLVEFLLKSLVSGLVFLTPQMPCSWQPWPCHVLGGEHGPGGGSTRAVPGGASANLGTGGSGTLHSPRGKWEMQCCSPREESLEGHRAPERQLVGRSVQEQPPIPSPSASDPLHLHLGDLLGVAAPAFAPRPDVALLRQAKTPCWAQTLSVKWTLSPCHRLWGPGGDGCSERLGGDSNPRQSAWRNCNYKASPVCGIVPSPGSCSGLLPDNIPINSASPPGFINDTGGGID